MNKINVKNEIEKQRQNDLKFRKALLIPSFGTSAFLLPNQLSSGGLSGVATITYYLLKIPMGAMIMALNIPLFILAGYRLGKEFFAKSLIGTISLSIFIDI